MKFTARRPLAWLLRRKPGGLSQDSLAAQADLVGRFDAEHLHQDLLAHFQLVVDVLDPIIGHFRNMKQALGSRKDLDKGAEIYQTSDRPKVGLAHFRFHDQIVDDPNCLLGRFRVRRGDIDLAVVVNVDLDPGLLDNPPDYLAAGSNDAADLILGYLNGNDARSVGRYLRSR